MPGKHRAGDHWLLMQMRSVLNLAGADQQGALKQAKE